MRPPLPPPSIGAPLTSGMASGSRPRHAARDNASRNEWRGHDFILGSAASIVARHDPSKFGGLHCS